MMKKLILTALLINFGYSAFAQQYAEGAATEKSVKAVPPTDSTLLNAPYRNTALPIEERVNDLFSRLTEEEKAEIIHGASGYTYGKMPRIGLQEFVMSDGPNGVRLGGNRRSTAFPNGIAMAATWNPALIEELGTALGEECKATNSRVLLAPGIGIARTPLGGRNFEYFGEDPLLSGKIAAGYIRGVQSKGIGTSVKHWVLNDQEWARTVIDVDVGERALREIYARPYEIAIKEANPWTIMPAYNKVRGQFAAHNRKINDILYKDFNYDGALISDWGAWHGDWESLNGGCTICMPSGKNEDRNKAIAKAVRDGNINKGYFEDAVKRNLRFCFRNGAFDNTLQGKINTPEHQSIGRKTAEESMVLLKNENQFLPLNYSKIKKIAVIGPNADEYHTMADGNNNVHNRKGGAGATRGPYEITPLQGIVELFGTENVLYAPGFKFAKPAKVSYPDMKELDPVEAAKNADVVLFFGGTDHDYDKEGAGWGIIPNTDKPDLEVKGPQAELIKKIAVVNPKIAVILINGAQVSVEPFEGDVPAILEGWYGGQDVGRAITDILFGKVNPSGKLPITFGKKLTDWLSHTLGRISYPGVIPPGAKDPVQFYSDYIWVGYRHFDRADIEPRYPFGFGLSYTSFKLEAAAEKADGSFSVKVTNTGDRAGAEVVQCYLSKPDQNVIMPVRELAGFEKVFLKPGESKTVSFKITDDLKRYWNDKESQWKMESGTYRVGIGNSSRNLPVNYTFTTK